MELDGILISFFVITLWAVADLLSKKIIDKAGSRNALFYTQGISTIIYLILFPFFPNFPLSHSFWMLSLISGVTNAFAWIFYFKALELGNLSIAQPITYFWPIVTVFLSVVFLKEPLTLGLIFGLIFAFFSIFLIGFSKNQTHKNTKYGLFAMFFWGVSIFLTKPIVSEGGVYFSVLVSRITFFLVFLPYSLFFPKERKPVPVFLTIIIALLNSVSFFLYNFTVSKFGSSLPAIVSAGSPALVVFLSAVFLSEKISKRQLFGVVLALISLLFLYLL